MDKEYKIRKTASLKPSLNENNTMLVKGFPKRIAGAEILDVVNILQKIGVDTSRKEEELLRRRDALEAERRLRTGDPSCVVCGVWSNGWLCPSCKDRFPWMHPEFEGY